MTAPSAPIAPLVKTAIGVIVVFVALVFGGWLLFFRTSVDAEQTGYRGVGMETPRFADDAAALAEANVPPEEIYPRTPDDGSTPRAGDIYENVQVLGHLSDEDFTRLMIHITEWVSPEQGCLYCHGEDGNFASDDLYTKVVSRRMIQMTQTINADWSDHVAPAGVNCYTCHRGQPVPEYIWFLDPDTEKAHADFMGEANGQNRPTELNGYTSLPTGTFDDFMVDDQSVRVIAQESITPEYGATIQDTERTYGLMMHWSQSLGVNCTYCHNSRAFTSWEQSPPARLTAWHGRRMAQALNSQYLAPLGPVYPDNRLGPLGDPPKLSCATCHQGAHKPLLGADMISLFPSLSAPGP